jgi:regulator of RNase E activity RraA
MTTDATVQGLSRLPTATISDALDRLGIVGQCLGIAPLDAKFRLVGRAFTLRYRPTGLVERGNMQAPISPGEVQVRPGDILVGDADGVLVIPRVREAEVVDTAREIEDAEQAIERETARGTRLDEARRTFRYHQLQTRG